jgi:hypothetical protein
LTFSAPVTAVKSSVSALTSSPSASVMTMLPVYVYACRTRPTVVCMMWPLASARS